MLNPVNGELRKKIPTQQWMEDERDISKLNKYSAAQKDF